MSAHVLLNLLNELRKRVKMQGLTGHKNVISKQFRPSRPLAYSWLQLDCCR